MVLENSRGLCRCPRFWSRDGTVVEEGKEVKVPRDKVVRMFRDVAGLVVVDGRNLLDVYQGAVEDCHEVREYMQGLENPL